MGLFKALSESNKKSKLMKELIDILENKKEGDKNKAYQELYNCIKHFQGLSEIVQTYDFSYEEFIELSRRFMALGFGWKKGNYIPFSIFCFVKPLSYLLQNKDVFENGSYDELLRVTYNTVELL